MKFFICLSLIACVSASAILAPHHADVAVVHAAPLLSTGSSTQSRTQDSHGNYAFNYQEQHSTGGSSRSESGSPGVASGSYTLNVADGRQRVVNYVADGLGFRAAISTNEPGTAAQPAASTAIASPFAPPAPVQPIAHAPLLAPVVEAAPLVHAPLAVAHAPLVHHAAPVLAAPLVHAPVAVAHHIPAVSSYASAVNHAVFAPAVHHLAPVHHLAAPVLAHGHLAAPLAHYRK